MKSNNEIVIMDLIEITRINLNQIEKLNLLTTDKLNFKENAEKWSILECIAHLNIYGDFYLPEIENSIKHSESYKAPFKPGVIGNYFVKLIQPKEDLNKMKTLKKFDPIGSDLDRNILIVFKNQQIRMLDLLSKALTVNLTKSKTEISIIKMIKMRLGDTLRFVVYHNQRHINQANRVSKKL